MKSKKINDSRIVDRDNARARFRNVAQLSGLLLLLTVSRVDAQVEYNPEAQISPALLQEDLAVFRQALESGHGGLYVYSSPEELEVIFSSIETQITEPLTERAFFLALNRVVVAIHDGHTSLLESLVFRDWIDVQPTYPPFGLRFSAGRAYIVANYTPDEAFPLGEEILAINGRPIGELVREMLSHVTADGRSDAGARYWLESTRRFGRLHRHLFGSSGRWRYLLKDPNTGTVRTVNYEGLDLATLRSRGRERYSVDRSPMEFNWHDNVPVLGIHGMVTEVEGVPAQEFFAQAFAEIIDRGATRLIVDLRRNGGGVDAIGKHLVAHLVDQPFHYYESLTMQSKEAPYIAYTNEDLGEFNEMIDALRPRTDGRFDVVRHPNVGLQQPVAPYFSGDVVVLIGSTTFSAATETVAALRANRRVILVGSETSGSAVGNTSGYTVLVELPHSAIRLVLPLHRYVQAGADDYPLKDRGFLPDYVMKPSILELLRGDDPTLAFALSLPPLDRP